MQDAASTLVFHHVPFEGEFSGGVETTIAEYLSFSRQKYVLLVPAPSSDLTLTQNLGDRIRWFLVESKDRWRPSKFFLKVILARLVQKGPFAEQFQVVQAHHPLTALLALILFPNSKLTFFVHNNFELHFSKYGTIIANLLSATLLLFSRFLSFRGAVLVGFEKRSLEPFQRCGNTILSVDTWYDDRVFSKESNFSRQRELLWVGRFAEVKDPALALRAFKFSRASQDYTLRMVGRGPLLNSMIELAGSLGVQAKVVFHGDARPADLAKTMKNSACLIVTSRSETGPKVVVEALASQLPVCATPEADPQGLADEFGVVAKSSTPTSFSEAIDRLLEEGPPRRPDVVNRRGSLAVPRLERKLEGL